MWVRVFYATARSALVSTLVRRLHQCSASRSQITTDPLLQLYQPLHAYIVLYSPNNIIRYVVFMTFCVKLNPFITSTMYITGLNWLFYAFHFENCVTTFILLSHRNILTLKSELLNKLFRRSWKFSTQILKYYKYCTWHPNVFINHPPN